MEFMRKIILTACILSIAINIADCIKPGDKFSNQIKTIFSLIFVSGIVSAGIKTGLDFELPEFEDEAYAENFSDIQKAADGAVRGEIQSKVDSTVKELLDNNKISYEKISSSINIEEDNSIIINRIDYKGDDFEQAEKIIKENFKNTEVNRIE